MPEPLTEAELRKIEAYALATWQYNQGDPEQSGNLIVCAGQHIPQLVAEVRRLRAALALEHELRLTVNAQLAAVLGVPSAVDATAAAPPAAAPRPPTPDE